MIYISLLYVNLYLSLYENNEDKNQCWKIYFICIFLQASTIPLQQDSLFTWSNSSYSSEYCHVRI